MGERRGLERTSQRKRGWILVRKRPFRHVPPWQRSGWLYGRSVCRWLYAPVPETTTSTDSETLSVPPKFHAMPLMRPVTTEQEIQMLEQQLKILQPQLDAIRKRLDELRK
ncbi:MAG: DUF5320 domain-containing protein [Candidatus Bathyarchaeota archaeon]|nr:DUF5320 domain-containing protein [Candidatus Bathyarchaeota archaeon]